MAEKARQYAFVALVLLGVNLFLFVVFPHYIIQQQSGEKNPELMEDFGALQVLSTDDPDQEAKASESENQPKPNAPVSDDKPGPIDIPDQVVGPRARIPEIEPMELDTAARAAAGPKISEPLTLSGIRAPSFQGKFDQTEVDTVPMATAKTHPAYPYQAKRLNLSGEVRVKFLVTRDGTVSQVEIISAEPKQIFNKSVIRAVSSWRFRPGKIDGKAVDTWMETSIIFNINEM